MERNDKEKEQQAQETPIYLTGDSTLQTPEEDRKDKSADPRKDDHFEPSNDDLRTAAPDRYSQEDRDAAAQQGS